MRRRAAKVDANQSEVVAKLRALGATVQSLAPLGRGCPDLLIGYRGTNWVVELKDGRLMPSARKLTPDEAAWADAWRGQVATAGSWEEIAALIGARKEAA